LREPQKDLIIGVSFQRAEAVLECDDGFLIDFNHEKNAKIICSSDGSWKTLTDNKLIHK